MMYRPKIILILERALFNKNHIMQLDLMYFTDEGYDVEIWSVAPWKFVLKEDEYKPEEVVEGYRIYNIDSAEAFYEKMNQAKNIAFVIVNPYHAFDSISAEIRRTICKSGLIYCSLSEETSPVMRNEKIHIPNNPLFFRLWLLYKLAENIPLSIMRMTAGGLLIAIGKREKGEYVLRSLKARLSAPTRYPSKANFLCQKLSYVYSPITTDMLGKKNHIVPSASYYAFEEEKLKAEVDGKYIVFIDQALTQDTQKTGLGAPIKNIDRYDKEMKHLFDMVEAEFKCGIVIAGHPKGKYAKDDFGGRKIYKYHTVNLIKHSELVITMFSTCLSHIIMADKPFLQISVNDLLEKINLETYYIALKKYYGMKTLNILNPYSTNELRENINRLPKDKRNRFMKRYINDADPEYKGMRLGEIILKEMI